ncbi:hypothetical protein NHQ30_001455 [Ciborinia camelliae]|nr:hypothetical protein NHQ30_001455 [Ciborinia camelliae]
MDTPLYALQDIPGKGKGLVAIQNIVKGTRIISEEPVITTSSLSDEHSIQRMVRSISQKVDALANDQRQRFLSLHNIYPYKNATEQYLGIFKTNGLPIEDDGIEGGIFLEASRINHACNNNAQKSWNRNIKQHTVHALKDISKGEEITIYYLGVDKDRESRRQALQEKFGFECMCNLCSLPLEQSKASDKRLNDILRLESLIDGPGLIGIIDNPLKSLRYVDQQVRLYIEGQDRVDSGLGRAYFDAAQIAIFNGDLARGRVFAERAVSVWTMAEGEDSPQVIRYERIAKDPSKLNMYGISTKWTTTIDEVPTGLGPDGFEDWLWKRTKLQKPGQMADLRNHATFPGFADLPDENDVDPEFYDGGKSGIFKPRRHWCFLGEIVESFTLARLQMQIKDVNGREIPLFFYTNGRGSELLPSQVTKGYTIAILYGLQHTFLYSERGIRHEEPAYIKVLYHSLPIFTCGLTGFC